MDIEGETALSHPVPRLSGKAKDGLASRLSKRCWNCCYEVRDYGVKRPFTATMGQRNIGGSVAIWLQCDGCGRAIGSAMARADCYGWQSYPFWNVALAEKGEKNTQFLLARGQQAREAERETWESQREARRLEYHEWLINSPEWKTLRQLIFTRCSYICEACLSARATEVHHETYELGKLPPAWLLRGICRTCHENLHAGWLRD